MNNVAIPTVWWKRWQAWLIILLLVSLFTRFWKLGDINEYVFDEVYHAFTAKMYALNRYEAWVWWESPPDGVAYEWTHPPLAKVIMSWGVMAFGGPGELPSKIRDPLVPQTPEQIESEKKTTKILTPQSFGWRFFSALFGVIATVALFLFVSSIFRNHWIGLLSSFLFTFDLLPLVQSRTAMNDIFAVTFMLFSFYFFTKRKDLMSYRLSPINWLLTGLFVGCAIASKWTSLFTIGILGIYQLATLVYCLLKREHLPIRLTSVSVVLLMVRQFFAVTICLLLLPFIMYLISYWQLFTMPIYDYKGNSLSEALSSGAWNRELSALQAEKNTNDAATASQKIAETERKIAFWTWLQKVDSHFADRYYIWWGLQKQMWWYHTNLNATHAYTSQWWTWPLDIRPVWFYVKYCTNPADRSDSTCARSYDLNGGQKTIADIYTMGNPLIFWLIFPTLGVLAYFMTDKYRIWYYSLLLAVLIILVQDASHTVHSPTPQSLSELLASQLQAVLPPTILFTLLLTLLLVGVRLYDYFRFSEYKANSRHSLWNGLVDNSHLVALVLCLLAFSGYWLPWARSPRIMFFYHFFPPVTFFYPLLAYVLYRIAIYSSKARLFVLSYLVVVVLSFCYFYPHVTGWQISEPMREQYYWLKSWK